MKKIVILGLILSSFAYLGVANGQARTTNISRIINEKKLQDNYLEALKIRYQSLYNRKFMNKEYNNVYKQKESHNDSKKIARIPGGLKSILSRTGELEKDKERIKKKSKYQVLAVNPKSVFLKRAMDYYVYGGSAGSEIMGNGNVDLENNKVSTRRMLSKMYRENIAETISSTRNLQKGMASPEYENLKVRTANYRTGNFSDNMISPFTSLDFMSNK